MARRIYVRILLTSHISGRLDRLIYTTETKTNLAYMRLVLPGRIDFPANLATETKTIVGGKTVSESVDANVAEFYARQHRVRLTRDGDALLVGITQVDGTLDPRMDLLTGDALQFAFARPMPWVLVERIVDGMHRVEVRSRRIEPKAGRRLPPLELTMENGAALWEITARFLTYVASHSGEGRHPLSARVCDVLDAAAASIDAHALTLAVVIEGTLSTEFRDVVQPDGSTLQQIRRALVALRAAVPEERFISRATGALNRLGEVSARDRLWRLVENGIVTQQQAKDWLDLRNRLAHANRATDLPRQPFVDLLFRVTVLFHHLVFAAIGYHGKDTDYGDPDKWSTRTYSGADATLGMAPG